MIEVEQSALPLLAKHEGIAEPYAEEFHPSFNSRPITEACNAFDIGREGKSLGTENKAQKLHGLLALLDNIGRKKVQRVRVAPMSEPRNECSAFALNRMPRDQDIPKLLLSERIELHKLATGKDGRQELFLVGRRQNEHGIR
jgi:hypothetical protein